MNAVVICSTIVSLTAGAVDNQWKMNGLVFCTDTGATGKMKLSSDFERTLSGVVNSANMATPDVGTSFNSTIKQKWDLSFQFSVADVANKIRAITFIVEELN